MSQKIFKSLIIKAMNTLAFLCASACLRSVCLLFSEVKFALLTVRFFSFLPFFFPGQNLVSEQEIKNEEDHEKRRASTGAQPQLQ